MDTFIYLAVGLLLGAVIGWFVGRSRLGNGADQGQLVEARTRAEMLEKQIAEMALREREREARAAQENEFLKSLEPLKTTLEDMKNKVSDIETQRHTQYSTLQEQIKQSLESDESLRKQTAMLSAALSDKQVRGAWGETHLQKVVELAGLENQVDFVLQHTSDSGRVDMLIKLPGEKLVVVDSKVPLSAYLEASAISELATGLEGDKREALIKEHVKAVKKHIDALNSKAYWTSYDTAPDFIICFVPTESILSVAINEDPGLLEYAFGKGVALASPVNLFSVLKTINYIWQQNVNTEQMRNLLDLGKELYSRVGKLATLANGIGKALVKSVEAYNSFVSSIESRVLPTARKINKINEADLSTEQIESVKPIQSAPKAFSAPEMLGLDGSEMEDSEAIEDVEIVEENDEEDE